VKNPLFNSGSYYDLFYKDKDYENEARCVHQKLVENNIKGKRLLELGCGTGKHAKILSELGYKILGIEKSYSMINSADTIANFECMQGDIRKIKLQEKFDSVISLFHVMSYQTTNESLLAVFKTAFDNLEDNGLFIFDVWYAPAVIHQKPTIRIKKIKTESNYITRIAEPELLVNKNQVNVKYTFYDLNSTSNQLKIIEEIHPMRYFSIPELEFFAKKTCFEVVEIKELLTGETPSLETWGICFILRKNG